MASSELHAQLLQDARRYDPTANTRGILGPYRDVLLMQRAKYMSYEQIAATFTQHGFKISPAAVGVYCRKEFSKSEIERVRQSLRASLPLPTRQPSGKSPATSAPTVGVSAPGPSPLGPNKRGPKIARDNY
jgi:hypothetical protein